MARRAKTPEEKMGKGGDAPSTTTQTTTNTPPAYISAGQQDAIGRAQNLANSPFPYYAGQTPVAGFSPMQNQYFQGVENAQGIWQPTTQAAQGYYGNVAGGGYTPTSQISGLNSIGAGEYTPTQAESTLGNISSGSYTPDTFANLQKYYDPAVQKELGGAQDMIMNTMQKANAADDLRAGRMGAFGGSGTAQNHALNSGQADLAMGQAAAQILPQAFNSALTGAATAGSQQLGAGQLASGAAGTQGQLGLGAGNLASGAYGAAGNQMLTSGQLSQSGAQALENSGINAQKSAYTDVGQMGQAGQAQQNLAQQQLQFPYQQYQQAINDPYQKLAALDSTLGGVAPYAGTQTGTAVPTNSTANALGTGMVGMSLLNQMKKGGRVRLKRSSGALSKNGRRALGRN